VNLGDDGRCGDGERERVAVDEAGLRAGVVDVHGIDQQMIRFDGEVADGGQHGETRGLIDIDAIYGCGVDLGDGECECRRANELVEGFALRTGELFGIL